MASKNRPEPVAPGVPSLTHDQLCHRCDPDRFPFETTSELTVNAMVVGQARASEAIRFGIGVERRGYNLFVLGPTGTGRRALIHRFLNEAAAQRPAPSDWCYVANFETPRHPKAVELPSGKGNAFRDDMEQFIGHVQTALPAAFESEEYQLQQQALREKSKEEHDKALSGIQKKARAEGLDLLRTPMGYAFAPMKDGKVLSPEETKELPKEEQKRLSDIVQGLQEELVAILRGLPRRLRQMEDEVRSLNRAVAEGAVGDLVLELKEKYADTPEVVAYLDETREDIVNSVVSLIKNDSENSLQSVLGEDDSAVPGSVDPTAALRRYKVNVLVEHSRSDCAPVIHEDHPTYANLVGKVEHVAQMGTLVTDFSLIRPGALQLANGGYLVLDARKVLTQPHAWDGLKRAIENRHAKIESPAEALGLVSTTTLQPEAIPLDVKVVLFGDRQLYYLLSAHDPDFRELFKVMVDMDDDMDRGEDQELQFAKLIAWVVETDSLLPLDRSGVARMVDRAARLAGDSQKLSLHLQAITDLLREADYWAQSDGSTVISGRHVSKAIDAARYRSDRVRKRVHEQILRDTMYIATSGEHIGQVNGLAVLQLGDSPFGKPNRITSRVRLGSGRIVDIERESELGGQIHSKGVLIISGYLSGRYAPDVPLSLSGSIVFEQSYGPIEGDSASVAELVALLSSIADIPVRQSLAVTGSVNQHGMVQPIGGVNEKIEGFFDVCSARGLTGEQGVVIPASNVKHLMLRQDVVDAVADGQFHIYPIETVDQAIEVFTGLLAGERDSEGRYPEGSFNGMVEERLTGFAERVRAFGRQQKEDGDSDG